MNRRILALAFLSCLLIFGVGFGAGVPNAQLTVSDIAVEPAEPTAGEPFTLTAAIESSVGSDEAATIDAVTASIDGEQVANKSNNGALSPGDSIDIPFTVTLDEPGEYTVTVTVVGTDESGERIEVTREETVIVSEVPQVRLTVDQVDVEPVTPTVGAPVTVPVTVASSPGGDQPLAVDAVILRRGEAVLARAEGVGALSAGESITVPLTTTFAETGQQNLSVELRGTNAKNSSISVRQPLTLAIEAGSPALEFGSLSAVESDRTDVEVTVSNPTEATLRNIVATVDGDALNPVVDRRVVPTLAPGESQNLTFVVQPGTAGEVLVRTNLSFTTAAGTTATEQRSVALPVDPLEEAVSVRVRTVDDESENGGGESNLGVDVGGILDTTQESQTDGTRGDIRLTVSNLGNIPVSRVALDPVAGNQSLGERPVADRLDPGEEASVALSLEGTPPSEILFEVTYRVAGNVSTASATYDPAASQGSVTVTGVDIERSGKTVQVTGDIGNPGEEAISGVVATVESAEGVTPSYPGRDFFIGEVQGNGFAPFELTATIDQNATVIPIEVSYQVAGDERTETVELPVENPPSPDDGVPWELVAVAGAVVVVLLATAALLFRRR
jgi:hypothetical protein